MATPHVAGVTALLLSAKPTLTYTDVFGILTRTTRFQPAWGTRPNNNYGWGLVQADLAVDMAIHGPVVTGTVTTGGSPLAGALITAVRSDGDTYQTKSAAGTGNYHMTLRAGTYTLTVQSFGYNTQTLTAQSFLSDTTTTVPLTLSLTPPETLTGRLLRASDCQPISGTVKITPPGTLTLTAPSGLYTAQIPAGTYNLVARAGAPYEPVSDTVNITFDQGGQARTGPNHTVFHDFNFGPAHDNGNTYYVDVPTYSWISGTTPLTFSSGEDGYAAVTLPFPFTYYGTPYTTLNVSTNGYATFNDGMLEGRMWVNTNIPQIGPTTHTPGYNYPNNALYPYWDDLGVTQRYINYGTVYTGVSGSAPNRIFVIEWRDVAGTDAPITFAVQLEETTNRASFLYHSVSSPYGYGYSATIGIENGTGTDGIEIGLNEAGIVGNGMVLRFNPGTPPVVVPCATVTPAPSPTGQATPSPTPCSIQFTDVDQNNPFYSFIRCLACRQIVSGYADGTFRWGNDVTRAQLSKIIAGAAGLINNIPSSQQTFSDVPNTNTFWLFIERLSAIGAISGYACGGAGEPCDPQNRPYFRWGNNATRGQISKITAVTAGWNGPIPTTQQTFEDVPPTNPFWLWIEELAARQVISGYACGGPGEPCGPGNRPYFRWGANATRGQMSKIAASSFFPNCVTPARR